MPNILISDNFYQGTSGACIVDLTPPTFAGINFLDVESRGQIRVAWAAATDITGPIRYEIYIQANTDTGLFSFSNIVALTPNLQFDVFGLPDGSFLENGTTYFVGVRSIDGVSNRDSNLISLSVISTGVLTSIDVYGAHGAFVVNSSNEFQGTLWATKNSDLALAPGAVLGTASYQVFNSDGAAIVGMSGSGISANSQGQYVLAPVASALVDSLEHYLVRISVSVDGEDRVNYSPIVTEKPVYNINGLSYLDNTNTVVGSFWMSQDERVITTNLGTGSYQAYAPDGTLIPGLSESGIVADANGVFAITPFALPGFVDPSAAFSILITVQANGSTHSDLIVIDAQQSLWGAKAQFSINALNQFQGTLWAVKGNESAKPSDLGLASYQVYDKDGVAVVGLSQGSIASDLNGMFHITPVSAALITDLSHYTVKVTVEAGGADRVSFKGFTLLGT